MPSCWSCTVIVEKGAMVCPLCGADQSQPVKIVDPTSPQPLTWDSFLHSSGMAVLTVVVFTAVLAGMLWFNFGEESITPAAQATEVTAKSLRDLREILSTYALSGKGSYPETLNMLGDRATVAMQATSSVGYKLEYSVKPSSGDGGPRGFVILARPDKVEYLNLFIDESGVVRATQESQSATVKDPPL